MYAVIRTGGKQYRVEKGSTIRVERDVLSGVDGEKVRLDVIMLGGDKPKVGAPLVDGAFVEGTVLRELREDKVLVFHKKRRKNHTKKKAGHRQDLVEIRIDGING
ncbi:MAG TPA: 50S ribosomal protein L21 [Thermoanaerobaculia bacterium]|nr:50S ribosomal protein L21 [Thermoanaerobaculia bacterium]